MDDPLKPAQSQTEAGFTGFMKATKIKIPHKKLFEDIYRKVWVKQNRIDLAKKPKH